MDRPTGMGVSTSSTYFPGTSSPQHSSRDVYSDCSPMGKGVLESRPESTSDCATFSDPQLTASSPSSSRSSDGEGAAQVRQNTFGGLEGTVWSDVVENWTKDEISLLESSWRKSTLKTYSSPWKQWTSWCESHEISFAYGGPISRLIFIGLRVFSLQLSRFISQLLSHWFVPLIALSYHRVLSLST
nr:unnamed protein product [Callosobruchus analis]